MQIEFNFDSTGFYEVTCDVFIGATFDTVAIVHYMSFRRILPVIKSDAALFSPISGSPSTTVYGRPCFRSYKKRTDDEGGIIIVASSVVAFNDVTTTKKNEQAVSGSGQI